MVLSMNKSPLAVALAFAALCANGCGTICNLASGEDMKPYGGLRKDLRLDEQAMTPSTTEPHIFPAVMERA